MPKLENLALIHGARASCSAQAIDDSIKDINYILEEHPLGGDGPYTYCSTYTGDLSSQKIDWWAVTFRNPVRFNCLVFTQGKLDLGGGFWVELDVQVQREQHGPWVPISGLRLLPEYDLSDRRGHRKSFESHAALFDDVEAVGVRLHGRPGGELRYTTMRHMAVYLHDPTLSALSLVPSTPIPRLFRLLEPERLSAIFFDLEKVTGIMMTAETPVPAPIGLDSYLNWELYQRFVALDPRQTTRMDEFERLLFDAEGGERFMEPLNSSRVDAMRWRKPVLRVHHGGLGALAVPVVVGGEVLGLLSSCTHFLCDEPDMPWHHKHARELGVDQDTYFRSLAQLPVVPRDRLEAMLHLVSIVANTVAELADTSLRREQRLREMQKTIEELSERRCQIVEQATVYMAEHLDQPLAMREVAAVAAVSPRHLIRLFRQVTGRSPTDILVDLRLSKAAELLRRPESSVTDVCNLVGYSSLSYFIRLFKQRFGVTPGQYASSNRDLAP